VGHRALDCPVDEVAMGPAGVSRRALAARTGLHSPPPVGWDSEPPATLMTPPASSNEASKFVRRTSSPGCECPGPKEARSQGVDSGKDATQQAARRAVTQVTNRVAGGASHAI
jgi:hypothetical protein